MPSQLDVERVIRQNPKIDRNELRRGQELLVELYQSGMVQRYTYDLETPESKGDIRFSPIAASQESSSALRRIR
jgi:hypothetical protein